MKKYIFIPIGSYEQHGIHLPPDTDYLIAEKLVEAVAPIFKGRVSKGINIGISNEHEGFENTKSVTPEEFTSQVMQILDNYDTNTRLIFINAHGGNVKILSSIQKLTGKRLVILNVFSLIKDNLLKIRTSKLGGICHAGEFETSIMLYLYPEKVEMDKLNKSDVKYVPSLDPNYDKERPKDWKTISFNKSGILGDPFHANSKKGELWFKYLIKKITSDVKNFFD